MRQRGKAKSIPQSQDSVLVPRTAIGKSIWQSRSKQIVAYLGLGLITSLFGSKKPEKEGGGDDFDGDDDRDIVEVLINK